MQFEDLPIMTQATAWRLLREAERDVNACSDSVVAVGYWVESHTLGCLAEGAEIHSWEAHWESWQKYLKGGVSILIGDPSSGGPFVSITPVKSRKATMGAEMLIELGSKKRKSRYIHLELISPKEDRTDNWILRVERVDPFGGDSWKQDFKFKQSAAAKRWFKKIVRDEDIDALLRQALE